MKKIYVLILIIVALLIIGLAFYFYFPESTSPLPAPVSTPISVPKGNYKNITVRINGESVTLIDGNAETEADPGSFTKISTEYFGNEVRGDFNKDSFEDVAFLVTQETGGTGTFCYIVVALGTQQGYEGTNAIFLGDRIAPQTTEFKDGLIIVNYADRKPDEPMYVSPSVGVTKYFKIDNKNLVEVR